MEVYIPIDLQSDKILQSVPEQSDKILQSVSDENIPIELDDINLKILKKSLINIKKVYKISIISIAQAFKKIKKIEDGIELCDRDSIVTITDSIEIIRELCYYNHGIYYNNINGYAKLMNGAYTIHKEKNEVMLHKIIHSNCLESFYDDSDYKLLNDIESNQKKEIINLVCIKIFKIESYISNLIKKLELKNNLKKYNYGYELDYINISLQLEEDFSIDYDKFIPIDTECIYLDNLDIDITDEQIEQYYQEYLDHKKTSHEIYHYYSNLKQLLDNIKQFNFSYNLI